LKHESQLMWAPCSVSLPPLVHVEDTRWVRGRTERYIQKGSNKMQKGVPLTA